MWIEKDILKDRLDDMITSIERENIENNLTYHLEADLIREFNKWYSSGRGDSEQLEKIIRSAIILWLKYSDNNGKTDYRYRIMGLNRG